MPKKVKKQRDVFAEFSTHCGLVLSSEPAPRKIILRVKYDVIHVIDGANDLMMYIGTNHPIVENGGGKTVATIGNIRIIGQAIIHLGSIMLEEGADCITFDDWPQETKKGNK